MSGWPSGIDGGNSGVECVEEPIRFIAYNRGEKVLTVRVRGEHIHLPSVYSREVSDEFDDACRGEYTDCLPVLTPHGITLCPSKCGKHLMWRGKEQLSITTIVVVMLQYGHEEFLRNCRF